MRSIDADALKKDIMSYKTMPEIRKAICEVIDNAPTVTPSLNLNNITEENIEKFKVIFQRAHSKGLLTILEERPQGEWIYGEDECGQDGWFCSECDFFVPWYYQYYEKDIDFIRDYKVCPHCLAEMVTYTGKDRDMKGGANSEKTDM